MTTIIDKHTTCPSCFSGSLINLKGRWDHPLVKCSSCSLVFYIEKPSSSEIEEFYSEYSYSQVEERSESIEESYNNLLVLFESFRKNNKILDLGCGRGWFLEIARKKGWDVTGIEVSEKAVEICRSKKINVIHSEFRSSLFPLEEFDIVYCSEVLEHVNNSYSFVSEILPVIRKGGGIYFTTPNYNSLSRYFIKEKYSIFAYPEHLCYFTPKSLNRLLKKCGLIKNRLITSGISFSRLFDGYNKDKARKVIVKDSVVQEKIYRNRILRVMKLVANFILNASGTGETIKAFYIKK